MNKRVSKFVALLMAFAIILSFGFVMASNAFASDEIALTLNSLQTVTVEKNSVQWFAYTPQYSANYTFYSVTPPTPPVNIDTYGVIYDTDKTTILAENDDVDFAGGNYHFSTTAYLEKGITYYFTARHAVATVKGQISVMLTSDKSSELDYFTASVGDFAFEENRNGEAKTDSNSISYYEYNYSYVIEHLNIEAYYTDGTSSTWNYGTSSGETVLNGVDISFQFTQDINHWTPGGDNEFGIIYMGEQININIEVVGEKGTVKFRIINESTGSALVGAEVYKNNSLVATSDEYGYVQYTDYLNSYNLSVKCDKSYAIKRDITLIISSSSEEKELGDVSLVCTDINLDGLINKSDVSEFSKGLGESKNTKKFDYNGDGIINSRDILAFQRLGVSTGTDFAKSVGKVVITDYLDLNKDSVVNSRDMFEISKDFNFSSYDTLILQ